MRKSTKRAIENIMGKYFKDKRKEQNIKLRERSQAQMINDFIEKTCNKCKNKDSKKCNIRRNADMKLFCNGEEQIEK